jgi:CDP-6-deoxy-D-xylo-4-hexulose-3-dehydrase
MTRKEFISRLNHLGIECRPIVAGNFAKNEVVKFFDSEVFGKLTNAQYIDQNGLFVCNQHYPIPDMFEAILDIS